MSDTYREIAAVLERYLSKVNAGSILGRALRDINLTPDRVSARDLPRVLVKLESGIRLFLGPGMQEQLRRELHAISGFREVTPQTVTIKTERDVSHARILAMTLCDDIGARLHIAQKVATAVSELARNILNYAGTGTIEIGAPLEGPPRMVIRAVDTGPGIPNLEEILSGRYRSKRGLGLGILGVKRLADKFVIDTNKSGTRVEAEMLL
jgi:serine/threonine-protein kinase RsbT